MTRKVLQSQKNQNQNQHYQKLVQKVKNQENLGNLKEKNQRKVNLFPYQNHQKKRPHYQCQIFEIHCILMLFLT
jgi:hypothetical protein